MIEAMTRMSDMATSGGTFSSAVPSASAARARIATVDDQVDVDALLTQAHEMIKVSERLDDITARTAEMRESLSHGECHLMLLDLASVLLGDEAEGSVGAPLIGKGGRTDSGRSTEMRPLAPTSSSSTFLVGGCVAAAHAAGLHRLLWRVLSGLLYYKAIDDPSDSERRYFVVVAQGATAHRKAMAVAKAVEASVYECPRDRDDRVTLAASLHERVGHLRVVLAESDRQHGELLASVAPTIPAWSETARRALGRFRVLECFTIDERRHTLHGTAWCPLDRVPELQEALRRGAQAAGSVAPPVCTVSAVPDTAGCTDASADDTATVPPTHFELPDIVVPFQELVDAYGIARYRELNPAPLAVITFPFFFGVMFGDVGHGTLLLASGLVACRVVPGMAKYFWLFALMGIFSIYCGILYNDFFGVGMDLFGSRLTGQSPEELDNALIFSGEVYPIGVDPAWKAAQNELEYSNSVKKKMALVFGVLHMAVGLAMGGMNAAFFGSSADFFTETVPQVIFFMSTFGYMALLIIVKWLSYMPQASVLHTFMRMFLAPSECCTVETQLIPSQGSIQNLLLLAAGASVPVMLLGKPLMKMSAASADAHGKPLEFSELLTNSAIHTIEFVLGSMSNTASYLRLWALSLAHAQLSIVFWDRLLIASLRTGSTLAAFIGMSAWLGATIAVILGSETLSALLHSLRLHWVEHQSKYFKGGGRKFKPFSYDALNDKEEE